MARPTQPDQTSLYVRPTDSVTPRRLPGAEDGLLPFWSADSRSIAFVAGGILKRVAASGGPPQEICPVADFVGGDWNHDDEIIFGTTKGLFRVPAQGGKPEPLTTPEAGETGHYWPHFLPDSRRFLYLAWSSQPGARAIFAGELGSKERKKVMAAESKVAYAEPGYLLFRRENAVFAQRFDSAELTPRGEPERLADGVSTSGASGDGSFSVAHEGTLVFYYGAIGAGTGSQTESADWQLAWVDRTGNQLETPGRVGPYRGFEVSPDARRVAVHRHEPGGGDIFVFEPGGSETRLTRDAARHNSMPIWSPDGLRIVYSSLQKGKWGLYQTLSNGSGVEELLWESEHPKAPMSWSPDSKRLVFWMQDPKNAGDLWVLTLDDKKAEPFLNTPFNESHAQISYDGKWIAYADNSVGGRTEVWVRPFPSGTGVYQVSRDGGDWPRWNKNGKELIFHALGSGNFVAALFSTPVDGSSPAFQVLSPPQGIVRTALMNILHSGGDYHSYTVSPDGQRFLIVQYAAPVAPVVATQGVDPPFGLVAVRNWTSTMPR
jgi:dipeptidyl aminopeptidase/acylaminoacyl peptidase